MDDVAIYHKNQRLFDYHTIDLRDTLPEGWAEQVIAAKDKSKRVKWAERGPGSLEDEGLDYRVMTADLIREHLPWLWQWFTSNLMRRKITDLIGAPVLVECSAEVESAININYVGGQGAMQRYLWHQDPQRWTMVLFVTEHPVGEGALQLRPIGTMESDLILDVQPKRGYACIFDSAAMPHAVQAVADGVTRVSIPMVYLTEPEISNADTNAYLYAEST